MYRYDGRKRMKVSGRKIIDSIAQCHKYDWGRMSMHNWFNLGLHGVLEREWSPKIGGKWQTQSKTDAIRKMSGIWNSTIEVDEYIDDFAEYALPVTLTEYTPNSTATMTYFDYGYNLAVRAVEDFPWSYVDMSDRPAILTVLVYHRNLTDEDRKDCDHAMKEWGVPKCIDPKIAMRSPKLIGMGAFYEAELKNDMENYKLCLRNLRQFLRLIPWNLLNAPLRSYVLKQGANHVIDLYGTMHESKRDFYELALRQQCRYICDPLPCCSSYTYDLTDRQKLTLMTEILTMLPDRGESKVRLELGICETSVSRGSYEDVEEVLDYLAE